VRTHHPPASTGGSPTAKAMLSVKNVGNSHLNVLRPGHPVERSPGLQGTRVAGQRAGSGAEPRHRRIPSRGGRAPPRLACPRQQRPPGRSVRGRRRPGALDRHSRRPDMGQPSREGQRDGQRRHYAFARWLGRALTESSRPPAARTTRPVSQPD